MTWELEFLLWIQDVLHFSWLQPMMVIFTWLGNAGLIWLVLIAYLRFYKKDKQTALTALLALLLTAVIGNLVIKHLVMRARPFEAYPYVSLLIKAPQDYSFPSGHAATSFAVAWVLAHGQPKWAPVVLIVAGMIAFSRLFLFVHYPTDVLAGMVIGVAAGQFMVMVQENGWLSKFR